MQAEKAAKLTPQQVAAQQQEEARKQEEELKKLLQKLPRPTMASRTETSVSLNLSRGNKEEQVRCVHYLDRQWDALKTSFIRFTLAGSDRHSYYHAVVVLTAGVRLMLGDLHLEIFLCLSST